MSQGNLTSFTSDRFGINNSALNLNGGYTQVPPGYFFNSPQFSVAVWVYPSQVDPWARIFDFANAVSSSNPIQGIGLSLTSYTLNSPAFVIYDQTTTPIGYSQSKISLDQNKWHFIVVTNNGSMISVYVNGTLSNTTKLSSQIPKVQRTNNFFGKSNWQGDGFSWSYLDDIRFYNISLNQSQIIDLMNDTSNSFVACLYTTISKTTSTSTPSTTSESTVSIISRLTSFSIKSNVTNSSSFTLTNTTIFISPTTTSTLTSNLSLNLFTKSLVTSTTSTTTSTSATTSITLTSKVTFDTNASFTSPGTFSIKSTKTETDSTSFIGSMVQTKELSQMVIFLFLFFYKIIILYFLSRGLVRNLRAFFNLNTK